MRKELPVGEGEGFERSEIDPTRSLLNFDQQVGMVVGVRFKGQRPTDLDSEVFHEGGKMNAAVRAVFDAMDTERGPKVTYQGRLSEHHGTLKFYDTARFRQVLTPDEAAHSTGQPKEGVYTIEIGDHLTIYGNEGAVIWQGRVPLRAGHAGIDEDYLKKTGFTREFFMGLFDAGFDATLVTRDRNAQKNAK